MTVQNGQTKYTLKTKEAAGAFLKDLQWKIICKATLQRKTTWTRKRWITQKSPHCLNALYNLRAIVRKCLRPKEKECNSGAQRRQGVNMGGSEHHILNRRSRKVIVLLIFEVRLLRTSLLNSSCNSTSNMGCQVSERCLLSPSN